jgi:hypothetical protein
MPCLAAALTLLLGCPSSETAKQRVQSPLQQPSSQKTATMPSIPPLCQNKEDIERLHGQRVQLSAFYDVLPLRQGHQSVYLVLPDGTQVIRAYRPVAEELGFVEKQVIVEGTIYRDANQPPYVSQLLAPHIMVESLQLASGETAITPTPSKRPVPPLLTKADELAARVGRWSYLFGVLSTLNLEPDSTWARGVLTLADGTTIVLEELPSSQWKSLVGRELTVLGKLSLSSSDGWKLGSVLARCEGKQETCGQP